MSEKANLTRARIVELKHRLDDWETVALRYELGGSWELAGDIKRWTADELHATFRAFQVLAEFPVTLADLLPAGCEAFRFTQRGWNLTSIAVYDIDFKVWEVAGHDGDFTSLADLQRELNVDLDSVVPLELRTHPDYVEAQR